MPARDPTLPYGCVPPAPREAERARAEVVDCILVTVGPRWWSYTCRCRAGQLSSGADGRIAAFLEAGLDALFIKREVRLAYDGLRALLVGPLVGAKLYCSAAVASGLRNGVGIVADRRASEKPEDIGTERCGI